MSCWIDLYYWCTTKHSGVFHVLALSPISACHDFGEKKSVLKWICSQVLVTHTGNQFSAFSLMWSATCFEEIMKTSRCTLSAVEIPSHVQLLDFVCILLWIESAGERLDNPGFQCLTGQDDAIFRTAPVAKGNSPTDPPSVCGPAQSESFWVIKCRIYCLQKHNYFLGRLQLPSRQQMSFFSTVLFLLRFLFFRESWPFLSW